MRARFVRILTLATAASGFATTASAQSYTTQVVSGTYSSIVSMGTPVNVPASDDDYGTVTLPFSFDYFGQTIPSGTPLYVTTNGLLTIGTGDTEYSNVAIPSTTTPNAFLAPMWFDQTFQNGAAAYSYVTGTTLVIEWVSNEALNFSGETASYQVAIDGSTDTIAFIYGPRVGGSSWSATIGLEDATGANGVSLPCSPTCTLTDVPSGTAIGFSPSNNPPQSPNLRVFSLTTIPASVPEGATVSIDFELANDGAGPAGASEVALLVGETTPVTTAGFALGSASVSTVPAGNAISGTLTFMVPSQTGRFYLALYADAGGVVSETNENDNLQQLGAVDVVPAGNEIVITTTSLPNGEIGTYYEAALNQVGASTPVWRVVQGALPAGLSIESDGLIFGTPTAATTSSFVVECSGDGLEPVTQGLTLTIDGATTGIRLTSSSLPAATVGAAYMAQLEATGGTAPYAFQVISGAPSWLTVVSTGEATGTPDAAGVSMMTVSIVDGLGDNAVVPLSIEAVAAGPLVLTSALAAAVVGRPYSAALVTGGRPPYTVTVDAAPPGFAVDGSGLLAGTGTMVGSFTMNVSATDADGGSVSGALTLDVSELTALELVTSDVSVRINADNDVLLMARGGVPPYTWQIQSGSLQPGLTFDATRGAIVGMPTEVATTTIAVSVFDADFTQATGNVIVRARFVTAAIDTGSRRGGGCGCEATTWGRSEWSWAWLLVLGGALALRRREGRHEGRRAGSRSPC
ncbi:MAG: putative Ig domain-containing protein [Deltaproteobacteria bacterium]